MRPEFFTAIASVFLIACGHSAATDHHVQAEAATPAGDQVFAAETELFGYYMPDSSVGVGDIYLNHISVGMDWEFAEYFADPENAYLPLRMDFEDVSSPELVGELGNTYHEVGYAVWPEHFHVTDTTLTFSGTHEVLGPYSFEGQFNPEQVEAFHQGWPAENALTGTLRIGDQTFENVSFQGWMGD